MMSIQTDCAIIPEKASELDFVSQVALVTYWARTSCTESKWKYYTLTIQKAGIFYYSKSISFHLKVYSQVEAQVIFEVKSLGLQNGFSIARVVANGPCYNVWGVVWLYQSANTQNYWEKCSRVGDLELPLKCTQKQMRSHLATAVLPP